MEGDSAIPALTGAMEDKNDGGCEGPKPSGDDDVDGKGDEVACGKRTDMIGYERVLLSLLAIRKTLHTSKRLNSC